MSTDKKSGVDKAAKSLDFEKLSENEAGQLAGGFSDAMNDESLEANDINIFKCKCSAPSKPPETT